MIRISTKSRYGLRAVIDIALHDGKPVALAEVSKRQHISAKYLSKIMLELEKQGIVNSFRGPKGGYKLAHKPEDITMKMLLAPVSSVELSVPCMGENPDDCPLVDIANCQAKTVWRGMEKKLNQFLESVSILYRAIDEVFKGHIFIDS